MESDDFVPSTAVSKVQTICLSVWLYQCCVTKTDYRSIDYLLTSGVRNEAQEKAVRLSKRNNYVSIILFKYKESRTLWIHHGYSTYRQAKTNMDDYTQRRVTVM